MVEYNKFMKKWLSAKTCVMTVALPELVVTELPWEMVDVPFTGYKAQSSKTILPLLVDPANCISRHVISIENLIQVTLRENLFIHGTVIMFIMLTWADPASAALSTWFVRFLF